MIGAEVNRIVYKGDGITTSFPYTFTVLEKADIVVTLVDKESKKKTLTSDYFIDMDKKEIIYPGYAPGEEPAEAERPPVLPAGWYLVIQRKTKIDQQTSLGDKWPFDVTEDALDKITRILQDLDTDSKRHLEISAEASGIDPMLPSPKANMGFYWDETGTKLVEGLNPKAASESAARSAAAASASETSAAASASAAKASANAARESEKNADSRAQDAESAANTAKTYAETATKKATAAGDSQTAAAHSASSAKASADHAGESATIAADNAATATTCAAQASDARDAAIGAKDGIEAAQANAKASATAAANSATSAQESAEKAKTSETNAAASKTAAANSASTASAKATASANSSSAAATSEKNAAGSASAAATSESNALKSASAANTSAGNAKVSETNASASASAAAQSASAAAKSAIDAAKFDPSCYYVKSEVDNKIDNVWQTPLEWDTLESSVLLDGTSIAYDVNYMPTRFRLRFLADIIRTNIETKLQDYALKTAIPTKTSQLTNDSGFATISNGHLSINGSELWIE